MLPGFTEQYDVVVVGGGHARCEDAMTAARMKPSTALCTSNLDLIAPLPGNPAEQCERKMRGEGKFTDDL
jgi:tRNA uridine 5-carboxymethylaminomethyl modification enzyme